MNIILTIVYVVLFVFTYALTRGIQRVAVEEENRKYTYYDVLQIFGLALLWPITLLFLAAAWFAKEFPYPPKWL